jgi:hypothetical protein
MIHNGGSMSVGNGACLDERQIDTLPWLLRQGVPGYQCGWRR